MRFLLSLLASTFALNAAAESVGRIQLLPFGEFASRDGRPGPGRKWRLTDAQGLKIATALNAIAAQTPIVIDYEHATLIAVPKGEIAPAAGWMNRFEWLNGQGLFSDVDWTPKAKASIDNKELRYISPVITSDPNTDEVTGVAFAALTNFPGLLGMDEAKVVSALNAFAATLTQPEKNLMDRTQLIALLGLAATATDADITNAITALRAKPGIPGALVTALGLPATADETAALSAVQSLRTGSAQTLDAVSQLTTQVAALTTQLNEGKLTTLVDGAIAAGKFGPAHRDMLLNQGRTDFAALSAVIDKTAVIPGLLGQAAGAGEQLDKKVPVTALSANQVLIAQKLGISNEDYLKTLQPA